MYIEHLRTQAQGLTAPFRQHRAANEQRVLLAIPRLPVQTAWLTVPFKPSRLKHCLIHLALQDGPPLSWPLLGESMFLASCNAYKLAKGSSLGHPNCGFYRNCMADECRIAQGALLMVLFQVSHMVEHRLTERASGGLVSLLDSMPQGAHKLEVNDDGRPDMSSLHMVPASDMQPGQFLLVRPGEQVWSSAPPPPPPPTPNTHTHTHTHTHSPCSHNTMSAQEGDLWFKSACLA